MNLMSGKKNLLDNGIFFAIMGANEGHYAGIPVEPEK